MAMAMPPCAACDTEILVEFKVIGVERVTLTVSSNIELYSATEADLSEANHRA